MPLVSAVRPAGEDTAGGGPAPIGGATPPAVGGSGVSPAALAPALSVLKRSKVETLILLAAVALAVAFLAASAGTFAAPAAALYVFPAVAVVYLAVGFGRLAYGLVRTPGALRLPWGSIWKDVVLIGGQLALRAFVPVPFIVYRVRMFGAGGVAGPKSIATSETAGPRLPGGPDRAGRRRPCGPLPMGTSAATEYAVYQRWSPPGPAGGDRAADVRPHPDPGRAGP